MFLFLITVVASTVGQNQMDWPDMNKYNQYLAGLFPRSNNDFSQSVEAQASGSVRTY